MKYVRSALMNCSVIVLSLALLVLVIAYLFLKFYFRETRLLLGENRSLFFAVSSTNRALHFFEIVLHLRRSQDVHLAARLLRDVRHLNVLLVHLRMTDAQQGNFSLEALLQREHRRMNRVLQLHFVIPSLMLIPASLSHLFKERLSRNIVLSDGGRVPGEVGSRRIHLV